MAQSACFDLYWFVVLLGIFQHIQTTSDPANWLWAMIACHDQVSRCQSFYEARALGCVDEHTRGVANDGGVLDIGEFRIDA